MYYVYVLMDKDNIFYVGKGSAKGKYNRIEYHKKYYKHNKNKKLSNKINKLNGEFEVQIVYQSENETECFEYEKKLIASIGLRRLCNMTLGGEGPCGWKHTEEVRKKMGEYNKQRVECPHCKKIGSRANMKRYHFDNCKNITGVEKHAGHKISESTKDKIRKAISGVNNYWYGKTGNRKGAKHSQDAINKLKEKNEGKKLSEEHRLNIKKSMLLSKEKNRNEGKHHKHTEEAKQKMRKPKNKLTCPHCESVGGSSNMKRYHFDNCKNKK